MSALANGGVQVKQEVDVSDDENLVDQHELVSITTNSRMGVGTCPYNQSSQPLFLAVNV